MNKNVTNISEFILFNFDKLIKINILFKLNNKKFNYVTWDGVNHDITNFIFNVKNKNAIDFIIYINNKYYNRKNIIFKFYIYSSQKCFYLNIFDMNYDIKYKIENMFNQKIKNTIKFQDINKQFFELLSLFIN